MNEFEIKILPFNENKVSSLVFDNKRFDNWPVVYMLDNSEEIYIGETANIVNRVSSHAKDPFKSKLENLNVIYHPEFNKSVVLHFEAKLIGHLSGLSKQIVINRNLGQSLTHNYFDKKRYDSLYIELWEVLKKYGFVEKSIKQIENLATFKYSPFKSLDKEQMNIIRVLIDTIQTNEENTSILVNGGAGTGKSIVGIYLAKLLSDLSQVSTLNSEYFEDQFLESNLELIKSLESLSLKKLKIGFIVPMDNFRNTVSSVFKKLGRGLEKLVLGPNDIFKSEEKYDVLIVDEAHRLKRDKNLGPEIGKFKEINRTHFNSLDKNQLDWILSKSRFQIFFYDKEQSIRSSDIPREYFEQLSKSSKTINLTLRTQFRVLAGESFIKYIDDIFSNNPPRDKISINNYEIKIIDDISTFRKLIIQKNDEHSLSRIVAGFSWPWITKPAKNKTLRIDSDFEISGEKFKWNSTKGKSGWIDSENSINEVGSIHTTQGFDLNYVGLIIGKDVFFDKNTQRLEINPIHFHDKGSSKGLKKDYEELRRFVLNSYKTMMKRGIKGLYLYIVDLELRNYLKTLF